MKNHLSHSFWPRLAAGAVLMATLNFSLFLAADQIITVPPQELVGLVGENCTVVGSGSIDGFSGNQINNTYFLPVPLGPASAKLSMLQWECTAYNRYTYYNSSDAPNNAAGWYDSHSVAATVSWNPNQGVILQNSSLSPVTLTLIGSPAPPPSTPVSYYGCGEYSVYAYDGNTSSYYNGDNTDPDPGGMFGGDPLTYPMDFISTYQQAIIGPVNQSTATIGSSSATVSYSFDLAEAGSSYPLGYPAGSGPITVNLNNPGTAADELRLDWTASYQLTAPSYTIPPGFTLTVSGTLSGASPYWEVAGQVSIVVLNTMGENVYTANVGSISVSSPVTRGANLFAPAGAGGAGWIGSTASASLPYTGTLLYSPSAPPPLVNVNTVVVQGYVDLIVDPGNITVQIQANPEPQIRRSGGTATVFWPAVNGWSLQQNTNLATATWTSSSGVTTSNGTNFLNLTPPQGNMFYRLIGP
jgi:hypothetical protein